MARTYEPVLIGGEPSVQEHPDGEYVTLEEYESLASKFSQAVKALEDIKDGIPGPRLHSTEALARVSDE